MQANLFWKRSLKTAAATLSWRRANSRLRGRGEGQVLILAYHRVVPDIAQAEYDSIYGLVISTESFARHLEVVRDQYEILTLDQAIRVLDGGLQMGRGAAVITFDDGYRDVYEHAWPVLKRMGLPATVYVPTAFMGSRQPLDHDRLYWFVLRARELGIHLKKPLSDAGFTPQQAARLAALRNLAQVADVLNYQSLGVRQRFVQRLEDSLGEIAGAAPSGYELMTWEMIREMADGGICFGAHSDRHLILTLESEIDMEREIRQSKRVLEEQLNRPVKHFAYPNGYFNPAIKAALVRAGFASAVTTRRGVAKQGDDPMELMRISLCEESTRGLTGQYSQAVARLRLAA